VRFGYVPPCGAHDLRVMNQIPQSLPFWAQVLQNS
jgi:hypothetical protein